MSRTSNSSDGISLYCSREMIGSESNNGFHSFNGNGGLGNDISYRRSSYNDLDMVDDDDTGNKRTQNCILCIQNCFQI